MNDYACSTTPDGTSSPVYQRNSLQKNVDESKSKKHAPTDAVDGRGNHNKTYKKSFLTTSVNERAAQINPVLSWTINLDRCHRPYKPR